jgi:outer membrane protein
MISRPEVMKRRVSSRRRRWNPRLILSRASSLCFHGFAVGAFTVASVLGHTVFAQQSSLIPSLTPVVSPASTASSSKQSAGAQFTEILTREAAVQLALTQASTFQQAQLNEQVAAEDVRQAQLAFLPKLASLTTFIYNSPLIGGVLGQPRTPSYIAANAVTEYQTLIGVSGELDVAGRLRATLRRNRLLLASAHAGTEVVRRALAEAATEAYYSLALANARQKSAEVSLRAAEDFEKITSLLVDAGEAAQVDLSRARLLTSARRDDMEQAGVGVSAAADSLHVFLGPDFGAPIAVTDLALSLPEPGEVDRFTADLLSRRPELAQFDAERRAAEFDVTLARAERRPQFSYSLAGGFDTDSFKSAPLHSHTGATATMSLTIPLFDWGASRSRERQARLRAQVLESSRTLALRGFAQQFYTARTQALSAVERIGLARAALPDAERNLELSVSRYREGEAQIIEVTDAQNTLAAQRMAFYQAIFDYQTAITRLRQATGQ